MKIIIFLIVLYITLFVLCRAIVRDDRRLAKYVNVCLAFVTVLVVTAIVITLIRRSAELLIVSHSM